MVIEERCIAKLQSLFVELGLADKESDSSIMIIRDSDIDIDDLEDDDLEVDGESNNDNNLV